MTAFKDERIVSAPSEPRSALREANRRYARLAISWYGVDPIQVDRVARSVQQRQAQDQFVDFLDALVQAQILTQLQAQHLRLGHAPTQVDPNAPPHSTSQPIAPGTNGDPHQVGPFRVLRRLGEGGMGAVYLAFDTKENRQVAVKVLAAENAPRSNVLQRFYQEGRHGAMLAHPNIVRCFGTGQDAATGLHFIVLEYVDGPSAHELLDRSGPLKVGDAVHIILDIARALEYTHGSRIIHRDIKPSNILLTSTGVAKLSDMGLAKRSDEASNLTNTSQGIGTPYYMPYEQAMNAKKADERCDIYALGATLYHLITGEVPFAGESSLEIVEKKSRGYYPPAREVVVGVPDVLEDILVRMLARDPEDRYQTMSELIVDLERAQLADTIPSFVNRALAMQDPVVQQQWTAPVQPTSLDLQLQPYAVPGHPAKDQETWFLRYHDRQGNLCKSKVTAADIVERLREGKLSPRAEAARSIKGEYRPLNKWPDFHGTIALVRAKKKAAPPREQPVEPMPVARRWQYGWWIAASVLGLGLIALLLVTVYLFVKSA